MKYFNNNSSDIVAFYDMVWSNDKEKLYKELHFSFHESGWFFFIVSFPTSLYLVRLKGSIKITHFNSLGLSHN